MGFPITLQNPCISSWNSCSVLWAAYETTGPGHAAGQNLWTIAWFGSGGSEQQ